MPGLLLAVTPSPSPSIAVNENAITPGVVGFLAILFVTVVTVLLILDMTRRVRRMRYRGDAVARQEAAAAAEADRPSS